MSDADHDQSGPHRRDASATRERLLKAAQRRFTVLGYEGTTTRDVAADAGVNVSLISRYFGSKEQLYGEVLDQSARIFTQALEERARVPQAFDEVVKGWVAGLEGSAWPEFGNEHPLMLLVRNAGSEPGTDDLRSKAMQIGLADLEHTLAALGDEDPAARALHAELLLSTFIGLNILRGMMPDGLPSLSAPEELQQGLHRVLGALVGPETSEGGAGG